MDLISTFLMIPIFAVFLIIFRWIVSRFEKRTLEEFPGPKPLPLIGSAWLLNKENHELFQFAEDLVQKYGKVLRIWLFHKPYVVVADPDLVEKILTSKHALDKGDEMSVFHNWWGQGLLTVGGNQWKPQRKLLNPTFSHATLLRFLTIFDKEALDLRDQLGTFADSGKAFDLIPLLTRSTLNVICETAMGTPLSSHFSSPAEQEYISAVTGMYGILLSRMTRPWLRPELLWWLSGYRKREQKYLKVLHGFTQKVIQEKLEKRERDGEGDSSFLDLLLQLDPPLSLQEIGNQVDTFMAAGHDTTAYTIAWTLYNLSRSPEDQAKIKEELEHSLNDGIFDLNILLKLMHLTNCLKESLRLFPIVPFNFRKVSQDLVWEKKVIPAGTNVVLMPHVLHKDGDLWSEAREFRPQRWRHEGEGPKHPFAYIPFSAGSRNCIGQKYALTEARVMLVRLLGEFQFLPPGGVDEAEVELDLDLVTRPKGGQLRFRVRRWGEIETEGVKL